MQPDSGGEALSLKHRCMELFQLLPTSPSHHWLIAADWLEEAGAEVAAAAFRERIGPDDDPNDPKYRYCKTDGYGDGTGHGEGYADGMGDGDGIGEGYRDSDGFSRPYEGHSFGDGQGGGYSFGEGSVVRNSWGDKTGVRGCIESTIIRHFLRQRRRIF